MMAATLRPFLLAACSTLLLAGCGQPDSPLRVQAGGPPAMPLAQGGAVPAAGSLPLISLMAGTTAGDGNVDGAIALSHFQDPAGVAGDAQGNVYVVDTGNHTIRRISAYGFVSTVAGKAGEAGSADGAGVDARFAAPMGLVTDAGGNLYVADTGNHTLRKVSASGMVTTVAGRTGVAGSDDGAGATFNVPQYLTVDGAGNVYVAERGARTVRRMAPDGVVTTVAGRRGAAGISQDSLGLVTALAGAADGTVYLVSDSALLKLSPQPAAP